MKKYKIEAKRRNSSEDWSDWTSTDDYDVAVFHTKKIRKLGYVARIVEVKPKGGDLND